MSFEEEFKNGLEHINNRANLAMRKLAFEVFKGVVLLTPVGNPSIWKNPEAAPPGYVGGHARANWQVSLLEPMSGTVDDEDASGNQAIQKIAEQTRAWKPEDGAAFLTNNLPYIERLENGWSKQSPAGMVSVTVARFDSIAKQVGADVRGGGG